MLQIGAGTGLLFILRWFWWRVNAISEIVAMVVSFAMAVAFKVFDAGFSAWQELLIGVGVTTASWVAATLMSPPSAEATLRDFCKLINPGGRGWRPIYAQLEREGHRFATDSVNVPRGILCMLLGCVTVYGLLFATGSWLYDQMSVAIVLASFSLAGAYGIVHLKFNH